jgi:hypothetical protein
VGALTDPLGTLVHIGTTVAVNPAMNFRTWISTFAICLFSVSMPAASVTLSWDPSPDPSVVSYNVYYGVVSGAYTNVASAGAATILTISNLFDGVTYYFAATALDNFGLESDFSNEVSYRVPSRCTMVLANLTQAFDGSPKQPTVTTIPAGISVRLAFEGQTNSPVNVGTYTVVATPTDPAYYGSTTNTFVITAANANLNFSNLNQTYDGGSRSVTVTTTPAGLATSVTYNAQAFAPTNAGTYAVVATVNNPNYAGTASNLLVVSRAPATITMTGLNQAYDGNPKPVTVTSVPAGLPVAITYSGATQAPSRPGTYTVIATVTSQNYTGAATNTLTIKKTVTPPGGLKVKLQVSWVENLTQFGATVYHSTNLADWVVLTNAAPSESSATLDASGNAHFFQVVPNGSTQSIPVTISAW